ncbi:MAG: LLM class flavin-dependent oxidoreductase [Caulobacteraceae bacterium]|nr:LLM class flavin-dependent oxidoreductase [Caulobacteraceae bacterium]
MKLGLYVDMRKRPGVAASWERHYGRWLERIEEADRLGCSDIWLTEHHFFDDGYLPQVWTMAAAIAARTQQIRIGSAVALLPLHSAIETAEQVALVDIISNGRVEPGWGVGYRKPEYQAFEGDFKHRYGVFRRRIQDMRALWGETSGAERTITPPPIQNPIPIWGGFGGPQGARLAGELGLGLQSLDRALLTPYLEGLEARGHDKGTARMGGGLELYVSDDPEKTWAEIEPFVTYRWESYNRHMFQGTTREHQPPQHFDTSDMRKNCLIGSPDELADQIRDKTAGLPVTKVWVWADYPGLSDAAIDRHIHLLVTELAPRLAVTKAL